MVGVLLITHGSLGQSLADCIKHVLGKLPSNLKVLAIQKDDDPEQKQQEATTFVNQLNQGSGVLVLSDLCGGTPSNIASRLYLADQVEVVTGVNLPMLLRAICYSQQTLVEVRDKAISGGKEGVIHLNSGGE